MGTEGRIAFWCDPAFKSRVRAHARRLARAEHRNPKRATMSEYIIRRLTELMDKEDVESRAKSGAAE
jgi:hypothetical protein